MFGFGAAYAELLRPDDARKDREEKETEAATSATVLDLENNSVGYSSSSSDSSSDEVTPLPVEDVWRNVRFANGSYHAPARRTDTLDTEADALAHGIDRQLFLEWTRVFERLDEADGQVDGLIGEKSLPSLDLTLLC